MKLILPLVVFVCLCVNSTAQDFRLTPGSYETNTGEKVSGFFLSKGIVKNSEKYLFRKEKESEDFFLLPTAIKKIDLENGYEIVSVKDTVVNKSFFATKILSGNISLYEFFDGEQTAFYLKNNKNQSIIRERNSINNQKSTAYKGILQFYIKGCEKAENKISRISFNNPDIVSLISQFNQCVDPSYKESKRVINNTLDVKAGINLNELVFKAQSEFVDVNQSSDLGFAFDIKYAVFIRTDFAFYSGIYLREYNSKLEDYQSQTSSLVYNIDYSILNLNVPLGFEYYFLKRENYTISINTDLQLGRLLDDSFKKTTSIVNSKETGRNGLGTLSTIFTVGANILYKRIAFSTSYQSGSFKVGNQQALNSSGFEFLIGYRVLDSRK